jgi:5-formyltetrahydrofolate cyclo-ligase
MNAAERLTASIAVAKSLRVYVDEHLDELRASGVAIFKSMNDEVDLAAFERELTQRQITAWFPSSLGSLEPGPLLIIVPGVAFDRRGNRLGRGQGYYDRLLKELKSKPQGPKTIGVGFDHQLVDVVPIESHDEPVDMLCMPSYGLFLSDRDR